jgi:hypothetical protein
MEEDKRISVEDAADIIGTPDAEQLINWAWKQGTARLRGGPATGGPSVEIPSNEGGKVDCANSRIGAGELFTAYRNVTIPWDDVVRLTQVDVDRLLRWAERATAPQPKQALQSSTHPANRSSGQTEREKSVTLAEEVASELDRLYPAGRPAKRRTELLREVRQAAGEKLGIFEMTTLDRAMRLLGWTTRRPKGAKARQPSR